jgi:hypothetical protein
LNSCMSFAWAGPGGEVFHFCITPAILTTKTQILRAIRRLFYLNATEMSVFKFSLNF